VAPTVTMIPKFLADWPSNMTPEIVTSWTARPANSVILSIKDGVGVGADTEEGHILSNCGSPAARFQGVRRVLLRTSSLK